MGDSGDDANAWGIGNNSNNSGGPGSRPHATRGGHQGSQSKTQQGRSRFPNIVNNPYAKSKRDFDNQRNPNNVSLILQRLERVFNSLNYSQQVSLSLPVCVFQSFSLSVFLFFPFSLSLSLSLRCFLSLSARFLWLSHLTSSKRLCSYPQFQSFSH